MLLFSIKITIFQDISYLKMCAIKFSIIYWKVRKKEPTIYEEEFIPVALLALNIWDYGKVI